MSQRLRRTMASGASIRLPVYKRDPNLRSWPALSRRDTSRLIAELDTNASGMASSSWAALLELFGDKGFTGKKPQLTPCSWVLCAFKGEIVRRVGPKSGILSCAATAWRSVGGARLRCRSRKSLSVWNDGKSAAGKWDSTPSRVDEWIAASAPSSSNLAAGQIQRGWVSRRGEFVAGPGWFAEGDRLVVIVERNEDAVRLRPPPHALIA